MTSTDVPRIAYFISPHGYGHAARAAAVMEAIYKLDTSIRFEIFTKVPRWFFHNSLSGGFGYYSRLTDVGLVQTTSLKADLQKTLRHLNHFLPLDHCIIKELADTIKERGCRLIICDIAPMGIAVAEEAGIPSLLIENFTWDWIYQEYVKQDGQMDKHIHYLKGLFDAADFHIQTEPVCCRHNVNLTTLPVSREIRTPVHEIRKKLGIPKNAKAVMITMGGIPEQYPFIKQLSNYSDIHFIVPGACKRIQIHGNLALLPHRSEYFHPDLVNASDAVIGKAGYSTIAEIYYAGAPFGYIARDRFRESQVLLSFIETHMNGLPIEGNKFYNGSWLSRLPELLALSRIPGEGPQGAAQAAHFIYDLINKGLNFVS